MRAKQRVNQVKKLLREVGLEDDRVEMYNIGASDALKFAAACNQMVEKARKLGPNPLKTNQEAKRDDRL